ncbi:MAG TPA: hypothetical protein P5186_03180 [Candidatus Paceibacterota bacterium]|nr:hypothetical protein [Verrucomicrobiota bacterium]HRY47028.1 hypothetical protein [Candidatus Paceibacterota bacterium]
MNTLKRQSPNLGVRELCLAVVLFTVTTSLAAEEAVSPPAATFPIDPDQVLERTCFQTGRAYGDFINLRSDVAIVYGIDAGLPERIRTWRDRGYRIHVMTGVSWGNYQDYLYGRFDGINHEDEAQTERNGKKISHGGDVYYMCPGENYGKFLCVGVQRALDAGAEAIHLEEPEFWVRGGYSEGFKREWKKVYGEDWIPPHSSADAQWRASKLKYFLYRRALQQIFDYIQDYNHRTGRSVRCYVPTHSLLNYAHWRIVSPESSLAQLKGCDGYIAQVWTGTSRTPNLYRGQLRERTFETAFLEYGAMQNLVRSTGRQVWYLNDPVEDNPDHDWQDYRTNWESTLVASLLQPEVWKYEVMPWPERIFGGRYPSATDRTKREKIPPAYATEIQTVIHALNDMNQKPVRWNCGTEGIGVVVSDSLMFQRGDPHPSDAHLSHIYGLALPLLKRGMPVEPVQLENTPIAGYLDRTRLLLMSYQGLKPLSPNVHDALAKWIRAGGVLAFWDDDSDPYNRVREWWNTNGMNYSTPRIHLFEQLGLSRDTGTGRHRVGRGAVYYRPLNPAALAADPKGDQTLIAGLRDATAGSRISWRTTNRLVLRRGYYLLAAGLDEAEDPTPQELQGNFVNLFDPSLQLRQSIPLVPGCRLFLLDLDAVKGRGPRVLAGACKVWPASSTASALEATVEGIANTPCILLLRWPGRTQPSTITLADQSVTDVTFDPASRLLWIRFENQPRPRQLRVVQ